MPPKPLIHKEDLLKTALNLVREEGMKAINARRLAKALDCSTKPLFRLYPSMDKLKEDVKAELDRYYDAFMSSRIDNKNRLLSQGIAYIEFARNEKMIFNALFMNMTLAGSSLQDIVHADWNRASIENARAVTGLAMEEAEMLFINFWLYSHGVATQIVSNSIDIPMDTVRLLMSDAFIRFSARPTDNTP